jgi:O-antigen/teichoic acid export membrane protein
MQPELKRKVLKNAFANLIRLAGSGIVALLLPPFLVRMLPKDTYGTWALLLQLTLYVGYLDFGIQTAVARFVAHSDELQDERQRDGTVSTAFVLLSLAATLGCIVIGVLVWQLPNLFHQMPSSLYHSARISLLIMGGSFALGLPISVIHALFIGFQRNEIPALISIVNKFAMALFVVAVVLQHRGLAAMGAAVGAANLLSYAVACAAQRKWARGVVIRVSKFTSTFVRQITSYSSSVVVWTVAMLMITGLDLTIVGIFDFKSTAYYAIAATLTNFLTQAQGAIFAALLPASAVLAARGESQQLGSLLISATRYGMLILLAMALPLILTAHFALRLWAGIDYAQHSTNILQILLIANIIRLCALPYSTLLLGTGQQQKVILSPLAEGITNLVASIGSAYWLGAIGVALGTLIGALVGLGLHFLYNMPRTEAIIIDRARLIKEALLRPALCVGPFIALVLLQVLNPTLDGQAHASLFATATIGTGLLFWNYGLLGSEREKLAHVLGLT